MTETYVGRLNEILQRKSTLLDLSAAACGVCDPQGARDSCRPMAPWRSRLGSTPADHLRISSSSGITLLTAL